MREPQGNTQVDGTAVHTNPRAAARAEIEESIEKMNNTPGVTQSGALPRTPKQRMLETTKFDKENPQFHHRFVNVKNADKLSDRMLEGYKQVPEPKAGEAAKKDEYGRRIGDELVLMRIPRAKYNERVARQALLTKRRERAHVEEMEGATEDALRMLRSKGINLQQSQILINEGTQ